MKNAGRMIIFAVLLAALALAPAALSSRIDVNVAELISSESKEINHDSYNNMLKISYDVLNSGSVEYGGRVRIDIFNGTNYTATLWSGEDAFNPGARKTVNMYWYEPSENLWTARARLYRAYEIIELGNITDMSGRPAAEDNLEIDRVRVYDDKIVFRIKNSGSGIAKNVIAYPLKHPRAWLFEQKEIGDIPAGGRKPASINYETGAFREREITIIAVSEDGKNFGTKTFAMKKEEGLNRIFGKFLDWLGS